MTRCEQRCGRKATVYAVDTIPGGWGGRYCETCARNLNFQVVDHLAGWHGLHCSHCRKLAPDAAARAGYKVDQPTLEVVATEEPIFHRPYTTGVIGLLVILLVLMFTTSWWTFLIGGALGAIITLCAVYLDDGEARF